MLDKTNLLSLMKQVAKADPSAPVAYSFNGENLSYEALNETLRQELNELAGTYSLYRENKNTIFELIEQTLDEILPKKVVQQYEQFAEVKTFNQGDKPIFKRKLGSNNRAYTYTYNELVSAGYIASNPFDSSSAAAAAAAGNMGSPVPEPTSGMLLLIGGSLLALRRRRRQA